ncbi:uncharacterized protein LOC129728416 [Wyeomyia smithii]|uniref:uncharacterized protein LOC129728416 n=1 Tax=Wyeomyia smithii TaxID=174621 RepID=UPI002467B81A|nr:uncharacterized protein LOC129728416 [Wyeomyia smithii]
MDIYTKVMASDRIPLLNGSPVLQETVFGWVVGGRVEIQKPMIAAVVTNEMLDNTLRQFWELESCGDETRRASEETLAEQHFVNTHVRQEDGRYVVELPFKPNCPNLGESKVLALQRLKSTERRVKQNWLLVNDYEEFMNEYIALGHMYRVGCLNEMVLAPGEHYFLPHHAVEKPDSRTTKCRVVFDGSAVTTNGRSLNDNLLVGPVIQSKLSDVVLRFRVHKIAFTADLSKMYRQVNLAEKHHSFQILWRTNEAEEPDVYRLSTVTYGLSSAPFQAVRAVKQLCIDEAKTFSLAAEIVQDDSYIDDILSGAETVDDAIHLKNELIAMFESGRFDLHKWCSNSSSFLEQLPDAKIEQKLLVGEKHAVKTLGIIWKPDEDVFMFNISSATQATRETSKRAILSEISKFYDPIGLAGPVILIAKLIMQSLWKKNVKWDECVDEEELRKWLNYKSQLEQLRDVKALTTTTIDEEKKNTTSTNWRHVGTSDNPANIISRGLMPKELAEAELWWRGPKYLKGPESTWRQREREEIPETQLMVNVGAEQKEVQQVFPIFKNCSSYRRMVRVMVWVQRFIRIARREPNVSRAETMSSIEKATALQQLVKLVQREAYPELFRHFEQGRQLNVPHQLITLSPTFDANGVLRVGGRLRNKTCPFDMKHQYILPPYHKFSEAIIREYHRENLHSGNQLTLAATRETFWIVCGKSAVKRFSCLRCFRYKPKLLQQYMGDLPTERVELVYPFYNTGVDFCGPVYLKPAIRLTSRVKAYICVPSNQGDTSGRFVSRRGKCAKLFSDNATNFVGGNHDLRELYDQFRAQPFLPKLASFSEDKAIQWVYIPPRAPSFGGLWEAVKGKLVVIREDNMPPQQWPLGRIEELFPGDDDIVRVVTVKTAKGVYKRALSRLSFLPIRDNETPVPTSEEMQQ